MNLNQLKPLLWEVKLLTCHVTVYPPSPSLRAILTGRSQPDFLFFCTQRSTSTHISWPLLSLNSTCTRRADDTVIKGTPLMSRPVFIKHLKSNVYVTLNAIGSFQCNLCSHWLIQIFIT